MNDSIPPPLAVDLDGTLVLSDTLHESLLTLLRRNPLCALLVPFWLLRGKAAFKQELARRALPDAVTMPYHQPLIDWLEQQRGQRELVLCTAADERIARAVADHLGLFDDVLASDGTRNLAGVEKAKALVERYGEHGFDYAGNARPDIEIWRHAHAAIVVNASASTQTAAGEAVQIAESFPRQHTRSRLIAWLHALRLHQWIKNLLLLVPLLGAHLWFDSHALARVALAFVVFGLCASSVYLLNDLIDLPADRHHPRKRARPFAAGELPLLSGLVMAALALLAAFTLALMLLPERFTMVLAAYYLLTLAYTFRLKRIEILDVVVLAALYTARIIAGAVVIPVSASFWLLALAMFGFLSLALVKRYAELNAIRASGQNGAAGRGYRIDDLPLVGTLGATAGYAAVLVLALYVNSDSDGIGLYGEPRLLWLLCPLLLYWISRVWMLAHRGRIDDDPLLFAVRDPASLTVLALAIGIVLAAL